MYPKTNNIVVIEFNVALIDGNADTSIEPSIP